MSALVAALGGAAAVGASSANGAVRGNPQQQRLFDFFSWRPDAAVTGAAVGLSAGGGGIVGTESLDWLPRHDGRAPRDLQARYRYYGSLISGSISPQVQVSPAYAGTTWDTPTADSYNGDFVSFSISGGPPGRDFSLGGRSFAGLKAISVGFSATATLFFSPLPSELSQNDAEYAGEEFNQCYGLAAGPSVSFAVPTPSFAPLTETLEYTYYSLSSVYR